MTRILTALLLMLAWPSFSATYYVATNGSDVADGSLGTPWATLDKVRTTVAAGDAVFIRGGVYDVGATYQYFQGVKGTQASPLVVSNYPGETPIFANGTRNGGIGVPPISLINCSWTRVVGLRFTNCELRSIELAGNVTNCEIAYCTAGPSATNYSISGPSIFSMAGDCYSNYIHDCTFFGAWNDTGQTNQIERGDTCTFGPSNWQYHSNALTCAYNVFARNHIYHGGHTAFNPQSVYASLFLSNRVHNEVWINWPSYGQVGGHRAAGGWSDRCWYIGNVFGYAGNPIANDGAEGLGVFGPNNVIRGNVFAGNEYNGMSVYYKAVGDDTWFPTNNRVFGNTFAHNALGQKYQTNLWHAVDATYPAGIKTNSNFCAVFLSGSSNSVFVNNLFAFNGANPTLGQTTNGFEIRGATVDPQARTNWYNNLTGDPLFARDTNLLYNVEAGLLGDPMSASAVADYQLQASSPCINAGDWLTTATGAGSGTALTVADPYYFFAGVTAAGTVFPGDAIQLRGQTATARVTAIDYATSTLTLSGSLTWTNGQGVALAYTGTAPDIGAFEAAAPVPPPPPTPHANRIIARTLRSK